MSLTSKASYKVGCGPFAPAIYTLPFPDYYKRNGGLSIDAFVKRELDAFWNYLYTRDSANGAAVIIELVQGEGGFVLAPKEYVQGLHSICKAKGILLIVDEVQTGFGRTGKWAAYEHYKIVPDISTWAKSMGSGMPIGAVIGRAEIMDKTSKGTLGGTYPGNPLSCVASLATIKYMKANDLNRKAQKIGTTVLNYFKKIQRKCDAIGDVRGLGAMVAFELVKDKDPSKPDAELCKALLNACAKKGLLIISAGVSGNVVRVLSPLMISEKLLMKGLGIIEHELLELTRKGRNIKLPDL